MLSKHHAKIFGSSEFRNDKSIQDHRGRPGGRIIYVGNGKDAVALVKFWNKASIKIWLVSAYIPSVMECCPEAIHAFGRPIGAHLSVLRIRRMEALCTVIIKGQRDGVNK